MICTSIQCPYQASHPCNPTWTGEIELQKVWNSIDQDKAEAHAQPPISDRHSVRRTTPGRPQARRLENAQYPCFRRKKQVETTRPSVDHCEPRLCSRSRHSFFIEGRKEITKQPTHLPVNFVGFFTKSLSPSPAQIAGLDSGLRSKFLI